MEEKRRALAEAKEQKRDEFYTRYEDVQEELNHYEEHFQGKTVFCNCDDPFESNFCKFFLKNFNYLGLKRLICTSYSTSSLIGQQISIFDENDEKVSPGNGYVMDIKEVPMKNGRGVSDDDILSLLASKKRGVKKLLDNGDFRSEECIKYLKEADIVVTNPPFSLFREYIAQLIEYEKKFIVLSNMNALSYKEIFPLIRDGKLWIGYGFNMSMIYKTPYKNKLEANRKYVISKGYDPDEGYVKVPGICWLTNLDIEKRHEDLIMYRRFDETEYPKYANYPAINVDKVTDIPKDYEGFMGVPITFLDKFNPEQFEIIGLGITELGKAIGVGKYDRRYRTPASRDGTLYYVKDGKGVVPYARVLIKNKSPEKEIRNGD